jgi:hypothetical protein
LMLLRDDLRELKVFDENLHLVRKLRIEISPSLRLETLRTYEAAP